jgi:pyruvate/2-oxoacid:ferredoxin oxidoreductase alpha subunit
LWPASADLSASLAKATRVVAVEASVSGELAAFLRETTLREVDTVITRRDGRPFEVEELAERLAQEAGL